VGGDGTAQVADPHIHLSCTVDESATRARVLLRWTGPRHSRMRRCPACMHQSRA
jgi:hypothetical protein